MSKATIPGFPGLLQQIMEKLLKVSWIIFSWIIISWIRIVLVNYSSSSASDISGFADALPFGSNADNFNDFSASSTTTRTAEVAEPDFNVTVVSSGAQL